MIYISTTDFTKNKNKDKNNNNDDGLNEFEIDFLKIEKLTYLNIFLRE